MEEGLPSKQITETGFKKGIPVCYIFQFLIPFLYPECIFLQIV